jgi:hypothetical protein
VKPDDRLPRLLAAVTLAALGVVAILMFVETICQLML